MARTICLLIVACFVSIAGVSSAAQIQLHSGASFDWWGDNRDNDARQLYVPLRIEARHKDFSASLLTAYADTRLFPAAQAGIALTHVLDTKLMTSYAIVGALPVDILVGLDFNLPSGKTNLSARQLSLIMDPDLISINNFGEGFDVNPTVTIMKRYGNWVAGLGVGYLWRGSYDFSSQIGIADYQPGWICNIYPEVRYYFSPALHVRVFGKHAWYGKDTVQGQDFFQQGDFSLFGVAVKYARTTRWGAEAAFRGVFRDRSRLQAAPGVLVTESGDLQGDEYIVDLAGHYLLDRKTVLRSFLQGRYFTENEYAADAPFFVGKREKITLGVGVTRAFGERVDARIDLKGFFKHDDRANFPVARGSRDFAGASVTFLVGSRF